MSKFYLQPPWPPFSGLARPRHERAKNPTQNDFKIFVSHVRTQFCEKKEKWVPQWYSLYHSCVCASMDVEASSLPLMAIHTQLWQLLFHSLLKKLLTQHVVWQFGSCFYFFLWVNEGNYNFWDQEINLKGGRIVLHFLFNYCYCKIVSLGPLKVCIGTKKQKDVIYDSIDLSCQRSEMSFIS